MKLEPLNDNVVIKRLKNEQTLPSGIVLLDFSDRRPEMGEVIACGPGRIEVVNGTDVVRIPMTVNPGDRVLLGQYAGQAVKIGVDEFLVMREADVFAILRPQTTDVPANG